MHVNAELVRGRHGLGGPRQRGLGVAPVDRDLVLRDRRGAHRLVELVHLGEALPGRPGGPEPLGRLDRRPLRLGNDGQEAPQAHDPDEPLDAADRALVHAHERGAQGRGSDDAGVEHAGDTYILHEPPLAGHLRRNVHARHGLADDRVRRRILQRRVLVHLQPELPVADQVAVGDVLGGGVGGGPDDAVLDLEPAHRHAEALGRQLQERLPRGGGGLPDLHAADLDREAPPRGALVRGERGVALHERDPVEGDVQLLGGHLPERRPDPRAEVHLAGGRACLEGSGRGPH
jgi:hypothetical protein